MEIKDIRATKTNDARWISFDLAGWAVSCGVLALAGLAQAADKTWTGAAGNLLWNTSSANWSPSLWADYDTAKFSATGAGSAITISGTQRANHLSFEADNYTVQGGALVLGSPSGGPSITIGTGLTATLGTPLAAAGSITNWNKNGLGTLVFASTDTTANRAINLNAGTLRMVSGSQVTSTGNLLFLNSGGTAAAFEMTGGTYTSSGSVLLGQNTGGQGAGTFTQTGGSFTITNSGGNDLGLSNWGGTSQMTVSGGSFDTSSYWGMTIGQRGTGVLTISGTGAFTQTNTTYGVSLGGQSSGTGTVNLDGGTMTVLKLSKGGGTGTFNFNGGVLRPTASSTAFMSGVTQANVRNGGAVIDTNGRDISIGQALLHSGIGGDNTIDGGLTKAGSGRLTLAGTSSYTGATTILSGALALADGGGLAGGTEIVISADSDASLSIGSNAVVSGASNLTVGANSGGVFLAAGVAQPVNRLTLGGVVQPDGSYGSTASGATHVDDSVFTGTGMLIVTPYQPPVPGSIPYANLQVLNKGPSFIIEQAAKTLPRANQVAWQRMETTFFAHFGVNTFNGVEWGTGTENPNVFNPTAFDADQWVREIKNAGGRMLVIVAKHHDGFCLWPSRYTAHDVASSSWMGGAGNVVRALTDACHARGIKVGLYLSPADLFQIHSSAPEGFYANGSSSVPSTIPTDPASFKTSPTTGRAPPAGAASYTYTADDYNRYFLNGLYELLTEYGTIDEMWFDGANPEPGYVETYGYADWYDLIHKLQPNAVIAVGGPDVRWVGNESGVARTDEWSVIPFSQFPGSGGGAPDATGSDLGSRAKLTTGSFLWWFPAECDVPILNGWFWSASKTAKSASTLLGIYYSSVGRNSNLLLNLSPDTRGLIPENQLAPLRSLGTIVRNTFAINHAAGAVVNAPPDSLQPATFLQDDDPDTFWEASATSSTAELVFDLPAARTFDIVSLQEPIASRGQRIEGFSIDTWSGSDWTTRAGGTTIGYKRLVKLPVVVTTSRVRLRITGCRLNPSLAEVSFHKEAVSIAAPVISERNGSSSITITGTAGLPIRYTLDGSDPSSFSPLYTSSVYLPFGGTVSAASFGGDGLPGIVSTKSFANVSPAGWTVIAYGSQSNATTGAAANAIDDNPSTNWQTTASGLPQAITIDMMSPRWIGGFTYLPSAVGGNGTVKRYRFETLGAQGDWTIRAEGTFGNIAFNPVLQPVSFAPVSTRSFRFTALEEINGNNWISIAEVGVIPAGFDDWKRQHAVQSAGPSSDPDGNGLPALLEYAAAIEPGAIPANPLLTCFRPSSAELRISLRHRTSLPDLDEIIESSTGLNRWQPAANATILNQTDNGDGSSIIQYSLPVLPADARMFYRAAFRQRN